MGGHALVASPLVSGHIGGSTGQGRGDNGTRPGMGCQHPIPAVAFYACVLVVSKKAGSVLKTRPGILTGAVNFADSPQMLQNGVFDSRQMHNHRLTSCIRIA